MHEKAIFSSISMIRGGGGVCRHKPYAEEGGGGGIPIPLSVIWIFFVTVTRYLIIGACN